MTIWFFVLEHFNTPKTVHVSEILKLLHFTLGHALSSAHIDLVDSYALLVMDTLQTVRFHENRQKPDLYRSLPNGNLR